MYREGHLLASLGSEGKVCVDDLSEDKRRVVYARIERARQTPSTPQGVADVLVEEYNLAVAALHDVIYDLVDVTHVGGRFLRGFIGRHPAWHPSRAREVG
jgi:hypothetical protein